MPPPPPPRPSRVNLLPVLAAPSRVRLLAAASVLSAACVGFAWVGPGGASWNAAAEAGAAAEAVRGEQPRLRRMTRALAAPQPAAVAPDPTGFMRAVHEAAARTGVQVARLAPRPREDGVLDAALVAPFPAFLRFAGEIELLGATLRPLQALPAEGADRGVAAQGAASAPGSAVPRAGPAPGQLSIALAIDVPRRAPVAGKHGDEAREAASDQGLRDPFTPVVESSGAARGQDLSATHRLTGITRSGAFLAATIDGMDYEIGDALADMEVVRITEDAVHLARGEAHYVIRFLVPLK